MGAKGLLSDLQEKIERGQVVVIFGAGVSIAEVAGPSARRFSPRTESEALVAEAGMPSTLQANPKIETAVLSARSAGRTVVVINNAETPWEADTLRVEEFLGQMARIPSVAPVVSIRGSERPSLATWRDSIQALTFIPSVGRPELRSLHRHAPPSAHVWSEKNT
jgi:hypothetical protein